MGQRRKTRTEHKPGFSGTIIWTELKGIGHLILTDSTGKPVRRVKSDNSPLDRNMDSRTIAQAFGDFDWCEHDGAFIHVGNTVQ